MRKLVLGLLLISVIFLSGCTNLVGEKYCSAIGLCTVEETEVEIPDVIVIEDIKIPYMADGRVRPGSLQDIIITLKNRDENKPVKITYVGISNPGIFTVKSSSATATINPGQLKTFTFQVEAPDNQGTIALPGHLELSVRYEYTSHRLATITYIDREVYRQYLESGAKVNVDINNNPSDGPVELYLDISNIRQPAIIDKSRSEQESYQIYLKLINRGSGEIDKINTGNLQMEIEGASLEVCSDEFGGEGCTGSTSTSSPSTNGCSGGSGYFDISGFPNMDCSTCKAGPSNDCICKQKDGYDAWITVYLPTVQANCFGGGGGSGTTPSTSTGGSSISNTEELTLRGTESPNYYFSFRPSLSIDYGSITTTKQINIEATYTYRLPQKIDILISPRAEI